MNKRRLVPLLFLLVALGFFRGAAFQGRLEIPCNPNQWQPWVFHAEEKELAAPAVNSDAALAYYPRRAFATERIRSGDLPLWDPMTFTGQPFLANFQSALLYPLNLPFWFMDAKRAMGWFVILHFALAGLFAYLAARALGATTGAAVAAGVIFQLNAFLLTRVGHPTFVATAAWAPLVVFALVKLGERPGARAAALLGGVLALAVYAGFPQTAIHLYYLAAWGVFCAILAAPREARWRVAGAGLGALLLSFGLAAAQLVPSAEFVRHSTRDPMDLPTFLSGCHHPAMLLRMAVPDFFGNPMEQNLWSDPFSTGNGYFRQNYVSTVNYFGVLPLAAGLVGLLAVRRRRLFLAGLVIVPLLIVWGTPLAQAAFHLPGFRFSRPDRLVLLPFLAISLGAALGLDRLVAGNGRSRSAAMMTAGLLGAVAAVVLAFGDGIVAALLEGFRPTNDVSATIARSATTTIVLAALTIALLVLRSRMGKAVFFAIACLIAGSDLFVFGSRYHLDLPALGTYMETPEIRTIRAKIGPYGRLIRHGKDALFFLPPATASLYGIQDAAGINALNLGRYRELMDRLEPGSYDRRRYLPLRRPSSLESPIVSLLGATPFAMGRTGRLLEAESDPLPRASLHYDWDTLPAEEVLERIGGAGFDPAGTVFLEEEAPAAPLGEGIGSADIREYEPDRVVVETKSDRPAMLLLTDAWYPGWEAVVDGAEAKILRADYAFRAVFLSAGDHVIEFRYRPATFLYGVLVTGFALLALVVLIRRGTV